MLVLVAGLRQASGLPHLPRPNVGPGFSEAATAAIGAMLFSGSFSLLAFVLVGGALIYAQDRLRTLVFLLPALTGIVMLATTRYWAPS